MIKFQFRLQKVLEYRELVESWAKDAYLAAQRERMLGDIELAKIHDRRALVLQHPALSVSDRLALERTLFQIDDLEHQQRLVLQVLMQDEAQALMNWQEKEREAEALRKLREKAYQEWELEMSRKEQRDLDEWAVLRRAA